MSDISESSFCTACGAALAPSDRFCGSCGASAGADSPPPPPAEAGPAANAAKANPLGIAAFVLLLAVGAGATWYVTREAPKTQRAVSGSPGQAAMPGGQAQGPAATPPRQDVPMPPEVDSLLAELSDKAEAAPEDREAWQNLTRARYRASVLNSSYRESASEALEVLFKLDPENLEGLRIAGNLAYDLQDFPEAEKYFRAYMAQDPDDPSVHTDLGSALLFQGDIEGAVVEYRESVAKAPNFLQGWFNLGIALERQEKDEEALTALTKARELAEAPEQQAFIDRAIAALTGEPAPGLPANHPPVGDKGASPSIASKAASNAATDFQREASAFLTGYRIVGPKIVGIEWSGPSKATVNIADFPMDKMPPVMRNKFKSGMNEALASLAKKYAVSSAVDLDLVDAASGNVMDRLDGKEWIGAFDEENYQ